MPSPSFWDDLQEHIDEGVRQVTDGPRIRALIASVEEAVYATGRERHYTQLAARLYSQHVAATRLQAAWRGFSDRRWYKAFKKTTAFDVRQAAYTEQREVRCRAVSSVEFRNI